MTQFNLCICFSLFYLRKLQNLVCHTVLIQAFVRQSDQNLHRSHRSCHKSPFLWHGFVVITDQFCDKFRQLNYLQQLLEWLEYLTSKMLQVVVLIHVFVGRLSAVQTSVCRSDYFQFKRCIFVWSRVFKTKSQRSILYNFPLSKTLNRAGHTWIFIFIFLIDVIKVYGIY